jgi:hypothetical protein
MCKSLPYGGLKWYEGNLDVALAQLETMSENDSFGRIYEVTYHTRYIYTMNTMITFSTSCQYTTRI